MAQLVKMDSIPDSRVLELKHIVHAPRAKKSLRKLLWFKIRRHEEDDSFGS